jgi:hypothetical protein
MEHFEDSATDISAMLIDTFIRFHDSYLDSPNQSDWLNSRRFLFKMALPEGDDFNQLLICAVALFRDEWQRYGIEPSDIHSLLPKGN